MRSLVLLRIPQAEVPPAADDPVILPTLFGEGYGMYRIHRETFLLSFLLHTLALLLMLTSGTYVVTHRQQLRAQFVGLVTEVSPYVLPPTPTRAGGGGGGGDRDKLEASKGVLPKFSREQITPPMVIIRNENPKLARQQSTTNEKAPSLTGLDVS